MNKMLLLIVSFCSILFLSSFSNAKNTKPATNDNNSFQKTEKVYQGDDVSGELEEIYEEFLKLFPEGFEEDVSNLTGVGGIGEVFKFLKKSIFGEESRVLKIFLSFLGISLMFILAEMFCSEIGELSATVKSAVALCLSVPILLFAEDIILDVRDGIESGSEFFAELIPIMSSVLAVGTGASTASISSAGMGISLSFISSFLAKSLLPVSALIFSVSLISNLDNGQGISNVSKSIRGFFNFGIGIISFFLVAILTFQGAITASADTVALRGAKYAASNMIPIVGSVISGALSTLASGVKLISSAVGVFSSVFLIGVMGAPLIGLLMYRLSINVCITFCSLSGSSFGQRFFEAVRSAIDCIIGILSCSLLVYLLEIILFTQLVGRLL